MRLIRSLRSTRSQSECILGLYSECPGALIFENFRQLIALMAANDVDAAEKKLQEIIDAAMEDGNIDEEEQKQIDEAKRELEKLRMRKVQREREGGGERAGCR
jgi:hypothetical protein